MSVKPTSEQLLADLVWVVNSPSLIRSETESIPISSSDVDLDRLVRFFDGEVPRRVGFYFERLVLFWLVHVRSVELVAHGKQICDGKITLGELDFLFRDERGRMTHLEVAVKFYLHFAKSRIDGSHFIGPNVKDTLEQKMNRMFNHQLNLSLEHLDSVEVREAMVKGRIFYAKSDSQSVEMPALLSPDHLRCRWMSQHEFEATQTDDSLRFRALAKPFWLSADQDIQSNLGLMTKLQIHRCWNDSGERSHRPILINQLTPSGNTWTETQRLFIVPNDWPTGSQVDRP